MRRHHPRAARPPLRAKERRRPSPLVGALLAARRAGREGNQVRGQQAELAAFQRQLQTVLGRLASRDPGPERCGNGCGCETDLDLTADEAAPGPVPWGTTLSGAAKPGPLPYDTDCIANYDTGR